jgi:signal transduction histidine kinase
VRIPKPLLAIGVIVIFLGPVLGLGAVARSAIAEDVAARGASERVDAADLASRLLASDIAEAGRIVRYLSREPEMVSAFHTGDATRQVLYNLTSNALKFTPSGGSVTCRARTEGSSL